MRKCLVVLGVLTAPLMAQDIHFSAITAIRTYFNPATTGLMEADFRIGAGYRDQWRPVVLPYTTAVVFGDVALARGKLYNGWFGAGLSATLDRATPYLKWNLFNLTGAYHQILGGDGNAVLSIGLGLGYYTRTFTITDLYSEQQITPDGPNSTLPSGEAFESNQISYIDLQGGVMLTYKVYDHTLFFGLTFKHLNGPREYFFDQENRRRLNPNVFMGAEIMLSKDMWSGWSIKPFVFYQYLSAAQEPLIGLYMRYLHSLRNPMLAFEFGAWWRAPSRTIAPSVRFQYEGFIITFSYDINIAQVKQDLMLSAGPEIFIEVSFPMPSKRGMGTLTCPRF
ncbi:MAG: type IX secretion system membrane protein PorP/SprF [Chlorobi bacterium]|nr:type IX secretion system membrane protein PorP/SprF [Chlorobiota bacterium]